MFTDGSSTTRSVTENKSPGVNIGTPVSAVDPDGDTLTYSLGGTDESTFSIVQKTGQLWPWQSFDYETKSSYSVTITANDGNGGTASIDVTVNITNVNEAPVFTDGSSTTRSVVEYTESSQNIGTPVAATDPDEDTLTYSLGGTDADSFSINSTTGQLLTDDVLSYQTKSSYSVTITVTDGNGGSASIDVTINVVSINNNKNLRGGQGGSSEDPPNSAPVFTAGNSTTRSIAENTASNVNIGTPVAATDADEDTLTYSLSDTDATSFSISTTTGQLKTSAALDFETKPSYSVTITANDGNGGSATITVTINVTDVVEIVFSDGSSTTRSIAENSNTDTNIGTPVSATHPNGDTLTYSLSGTDATSFSIRSTTGQLQISAALDYETKSSYSVTVTAADSNGNSASIPVTISVTNLNDNAPVFTDGDSTSRAIGMNKPRNTPIGSAVSATDADGDTLTYSLSGTHASKFSFDRNTGQLKIRHSFNDGIKVTIGVSDGIYTDSITVTVNVDITPKFNDGSSTTRSVAENSPAHTNVGSPITATDPSGQTLTYEFSPEGLTLAEQVAASFLFYIDSETGQIKTRNELNYEAHSSHRLKVKVSNGYAPRFARGSAIITVTVNVIDVAESPASQQSPPKTELLANYPNPFNPETWIPYQLSESAKVTVTIYSVKGEMVRQFALGHQAAGDYRSRARALHWDGKNQFGEKVSTGVYFYRFTAGDFSATRRMLIIK
ncbi:T9SS type A sorting domain-containing protein [Candidatus Poribacteria bacterium]|nr:T9SS type A sorting domain-containing protein [Candidatus Poribacteria bacterium]